MKWHDVSRPLEENMLVFPGDLVPAFHQEKQNHYLISTLHLSSHTGTHIDAPSHYVAGGASIDCIPLDSLIGSCRIIDLKDCGTDITKKDLVGRTGTAQRLLLKTWFSGRHRFEEHFPSLSIDAAEYLVSRKTRCVGIDSPSIESFHCDGSVHRKLLGAGCLVLELLDLSGTDPGEFEMIALPLRLKGLDGSPARVLVRGAGDRK